MIHLSNIHPLTDFKRNTARFRSRLKATGMPEVLTVEGQPELVVQDAGAYQRLLDLVDRTDAVRAIQEGLDDAKAGRTTSLATFDREFRKRHRLPKRP